MTCVISTERVQQGIARYDQMIAHRAKVTTTSPGWILSFAFSAIRSSAAVRRSAIQPSMAAMRLDFCYTVSSAIYIALRAAWGRSTVSGSMDAPLLPTGPHPHFRPTA